VPARTDARSKAPLLMFGLLLGGAPLAGPHALEVSFQGRSVGTAGAVFAMPGERIELELDARSREAGATMVGDVGVLIELEPGLWQWQAPVTAGSFGTLELRAPGDPPGRIELNAFVLVPASRMTNGRMGKFRIDDYPSNRPAKSPERYAPPIGFVEVTEANRERRVSPSFKIGQFVSKQMGGWPKYVVPSVRLYAKLEAMLGAVRAAGFDAETLHIMSGYRTPFYNRALGNVRFSRHIYGDAADVFVDIDGNEYMDDLNRDGRIDIDDAATLASWLEGAESDSGLAPLVGGLGVYRATQFHGPFVHLDARGHRARWGYRPR